MAAVGSLKKSMNKINCTGYLTYGRIAYDVVLLMGNNSGTKSDFDQGDTFDNQRVHIDANYKFDVIPPEVDALLTAIAVVRVFKDMVLFQRNSGANHQSWCR